MTSQKKKPAGSKRVREKHGRSGADQGHRFLFVWVPVIILVLALFYAVMFDPPKPVGRPLSGTISGTDQGRPGQPMASSVSVALEDGRVVSIRPSDMEGELRKGRPVLVQENETLIFKRRTYSFVGRLDGK